MSDDLKSILCPDREIPWDEAASYFLVTKEATEATKTDPISEQKIKGVLSGIRSATASDITHAQRIKRTRGERSGKGAGTVTGGTLGYLAGKGGWKSRAAGTAIGAVLGGGLGKTIGQEVDRARIVEKYRPKPKKAEMEKHTKVAEVRRLWKLAQGEPTTEAEAGPAGATPSPQAVEPGAVTGEQAPTLLQTAPKAGKGPKVPGPTPEQLEASRAAQALQEEAVLDELGAQEEAEYYRQLLEQTSAERDELGAQAQEAQMAAQQAAQQAQMVQMQADQATQQAAAQAQMAAQEKQQLSMQLEGAATEALQNKENLMQMRQAMQNYRENLQSIVLQDPTAAAGPTPEEQGMEPPPSEQMAAQGADQQAVEEAQQAEQAQQEAAQQTAQAEQAAVNEAAKEQAPPKPKKAQKQSGNNPNVTVNVEKKSSAIPELLEADPSFDKKAASLKERAIGAAIGAPLAAGIQSISDIRGEGGKSKKEIALERRLKDIQAKKGKGALSRHHENVVRTMLETARINREHPRSAAAMAAGIGALGGGMFGPTISRGIKGAFQAAARRGGK